jgi:hypothetical protein
VKGTNAFILGSGIQLMEAAISKANSSGVTTPRFIPELDIKVYRRSYPHQQGQ